MKCNFTVFVCSVLCLSTIQSVSSQNAMTPPRGWNSYDSFSWIVSEEEYLQNANIVSQNLLAHGYEYAVVDYLWYRNLKGDSNSRGFDLIDKWGRLLPDPERWPSSRGGKGFADVSNKVHRMGLKFGIHLMAGLSTQAFDNNAPILDTRTGQPYTESGRTWTAKDIGIPSRACSWMNDGFMAINATTGAGKAFLRSIYELYAFWGVDLVKLDCVFGENLDLGEITSVSEILSGLNHPIVLSLSPGVAATPEMANSVSSLANAYRVTGDVWDEWSTILAHFDIARDFAAANLMGVDGLKGKSWPDLDMLPFGWITDPAAHEGPHRYCKLTLHEQQTQMTLWSMAKSPIMYGGDLRKIDPWTQGLITNPTLLEINSYSENNQEFPHVRTTNGVKTEAHNVTKVPFSYSLALTECTDPKASGWSGEKYNQDPERICYKSPAQGQEDPLCADKRELPIASSKQTFIQSQQTWELKSNGTLVNSHSGMCAKVEHVLGPSGIRAWIATGRTGEVYVALFNLLNYTTTISANVADLAMVYPRGNRKLTSCVGTEIWSNTNIPPTNTLSIQLLSHGSALFVLHCE